MASKRVTKELKDLQEHPPVSCSAAHGTTAIAVKCEDFVLVACDSRRSWTYIEHENGVEIQKSFYQDDAVKIQKLGDNFVAVISGNANVARGCLAELADLIVPRQSTLRRPLYVSEVALMFGDMVSRIPTAARDNIPFAVFIAGTDKHQIREGLSVNVFYTKDVFFVDINGTVEKITDHKAMGSGTVWAEVYLRAVYRRSMPLGSAFRMVRDSIQLASNWDQYTGGIIHVYQLDHTHPDLASRIVLD